MDYALFQIQRLLMGSGGIELSAKHPVRERVERPGAHWSDRGAHVVLKVRSYQLSGLPIA